MPDTRDPLIPADRFPAVVAPASTSPISPPTHLAPITDSINQEKLRQLRTGYSNKAGLRLNTVQGGTAEVFADWTRGPLTVTGYSSWTRRQGFGAGAEATWDFSKKG